MELKQLIGIIVLALLMFFGFSMLNETKKSGESGISNLFSWDTKNNFDGSLSLGHKALHVKIRPFEDGIISDDELEVYEFHLTDQGAMGKKHYSDKGIDPGVTDVSQYFDIKNWKGDKCTLFTTKVTPEPELKVDPFDNNYIYYIYPGTIINHGIADIATAINGRYERGCETIKCSDVGTGKYTICADECTDVLGGICKRYDFKCDERASDKVIEQDFGSGLNSCNKDTEGCPSEANGGCCSLLKDVPNRYTLRYGLICGYEQINGKTADTTAKWFACTGDIDSAKTVFNSKTNGIQFNCGSGRWLPTTDQGVNLENAQIRYHESSLDKHTDLKFYVANNNRGYNIKDVSVKVKITNADIDCKSSIGTVNDCTELAADKSKDGKWGEVTNGREFSSEGLTCPISLGADDEDLCWKAKSFDVELKYKYSEKDFTDNFKITCGTKSMEADGIWDDKVCTISKV